MQGHGFVKDSKVLSLRLYVIPQRGPELWANPALGARLEAFFLSS